MSSALADAFKAARREEARKALDIFLQAYPEARELLYQDTRQPQPAVSASPSALAMPVPPAVSKPSRRDDFFKRKLSDDDVQDIRRRLVAGERREAIAQTFDVSADSVYAIGRGKMRGHLPMTPEFQAWQKQKYGKSASRR